MIRRQEARIDVERLLARLLRIGRLHHAVGGHTVEHVVAARDRGVTIAERVQRARRLRQRREVSRFRQRQLVDRLAIVVQRRGGDAVVTQAEIDLVEIEFEDLVLRISRLDPEREQHFANLTLERALVGQKEVLGDLLRDGRGALHAAIALDQDHGRADDAFRIDTGVAVEILVFRRDESILDQRRDRLDRQEQTALARIFGQDTAVARMHAGHHRGFVVTELGVVRQVLLVPPDQHACRSRAQHE